MHAIEDAPGLRERKKRRTRDALIRSALELFSLKGYEGTTVDEIAAAADVSQRTFFRYFTNKEEVALSVQLMAESRFFAAFLERPAAESPLTALRTAVLASWDGIEEAIEAVVPLELHVRTYGMIQETPQLLAAHLRRLAELEDRLAAEIARREGLPPQDPRPRILVAAFSGVMRETSKLWADAAGGDFSELRGTTAAYLDQIGPALAENWRS
ncbi:TetR/AcrR family transcriptional regulator [Streptomyces griseocarneus]|uniref:TetR/AcrR family transcriptional regulator n=1 Tax=Streptomyces griseocarneus TaxID=51201 RepID=UPI00167E120B|nr:TetR family transcriptional regulator [Streptomyces griseocarneus]MBZ6472236.1 TetR family transcriptional regulator [Streptomyces griseocarneus]GHG73085.1 TetR family transcriptional regulator [Streptomyces griseocarneus]